MQTVLRSGEPGPYQAVVAGCIGIDTNVFLYGEDIDWSVEANFSEDLDYVGGAGGCGTRSLRRLGLRTAFLGALGDDYQGEAIKSELAREGIDALFFRDPKGTHRSVNMMYRDGRRKNFYDGKGQMEVLPDLEACRDWLRGARLLHAQLENWVRHLLPIARELGVTVNAESRRLESEALAAMTRQGLQTVPVDAGPWRAALERSWPVLRGGAVPAAYFDEAVAARDACRSQASR
jgi:sugar/nucleoside kinase (ribokinase family)